MAAAGDRVLAHGGWWLSTGATVTGIEEMVSTEGRKGPTDGCWRSVSKRARRGDGDSLHSKTGTGGRGGTAVGRAAGKKSWWQWTSWGGQQLAAAATRHLERCSATHGAASCEVWAERGRLTPSGPAQQQQQQQAQGGTKRRLQSRLSSPGGRRAAIMIMVQPCPLHDSTGPGPAIASAAGLGGRAWLPRGLAEARRAVSISQ